MAAKELAVWGVSAEVLKLNRISPLDWDELSPLLGHTDWLMSVEDCFNNGCVGARLAALLAEHGRAPKRLTLKNLGDRFAPAGAVPLLRRQFGLDAQSLASAVLAGSGVIGEARANAQQ